MRNVEPYGSDPAVRREAVHDRAHRVLAHAEVEVAAGVAPAAAVEPCDRRSRRRIEIAESLERGVRRRIEIGRAADQRRQPRRDRIHHLARRRRAWRCPWRRRERPGCPRPSRAAARRACVARSSCGQLGEGARVGRHAIVPRRLGARAARDRLAEMRQRRLRESGTAARSASRAAALVRRTSSAPSGEPCASKVSCLCGEP